MTIDQYVENINRRYAMGNTTEHSFRGDLQQLIESLLPNVAATNEPKRQACGAPDYIVTIKEIPVGYIEAKDIGDGDLSGLKKGGNKEQFDRYKESLSNLIITDYLRFLFYLNGEEVAQVEIGSIVGGKIIPKPDNFNSLQYFLNVFLSHKGQTIRSPKKLAEMMAGRARLLADVIERALTSDEENHENTTLREQLAGFKEILIHDITPRGFADVYAQTIAYGMFAARLHDPTLPTFGRQEAAELIPKSNPFLRKLFAYIAGPDLDDRIKWIVDNLVEIFLASNVEEILKGYGKSTQTEDPIIHFYETFLSEYDPKLRKARGVWYTPQPVVNFIVRAVDDILKTEFGLPQGLADTSKIKIKVDQQGKKVEKEVHRVQILDPAAGTGTFLAEVIRQIHSRFEGQQGIWSNYVEQHLLPRLNGFEILMASYAMAHLKLDLLLTETGYKPTTNQRFKVYLTNSLEEHHADTGTLFANWLSAEANEANQIKRDTPVMCVIGNPPYAVSSSNKGEWIQNLIKDYKKDLNEKKINLDDDYIKFIRYGQYLINKNGSGILAYISNNSFLDGITHRQMRKYLTESFSKIYIINLHGNSKKQESSPDGGIDQNVFDIMQGVSINIFIRDMSNTKNNICEIIYRDLYGTRSNKYNLLINTNLNSIQSSVINAHSPYYYFVPKSFQDIKQYEKGFKLDSIFTNNNTGIQTKRDGLVYQFNKKELYVVLNDIVNLNNTDLKSKYNLPSDGRDWTIDLARKDLLQKDGIEVIVSYHPFDKRYSYFSGRSKGFMAYPRTPLSESCIDNNISILAVRNSRRGNVNNYFIVNSLVDKDGISPFDNCKFFPLYLNSNNSNKSNSINLTFNRVPNINLDIIHQFESKINLVYNTEQVFDKNKFSPIDILDYIYAILYSPTYREKYKEFLKIDFPRIPYPKDKDTFWQLIELGGELRQIHLLESPVVEKYITTYPMDGNNIVTKVKYQDGKVYINEQQYFDHVPEIAWNFYIGGYQPAQKWLKDRKDRKLEFEDILHYQKIIVALTETHRLMGEIDKINFE
jgi:predicted helicase